MDRTILIADDSSTIRRIVEHTFAECDVRVLVASDGLEAVETARRECLDLALIDVLMPRMTGYEVAEILGRDAATASVPVILLSGAFEPFDEERAESCGAVGSLSKPFEGQALVARVEEIFARHPPARRVTIERKPVMQGAEPRDANPLGELEAPAARMRSVTDAKDEPLEDAALLDSLPAIEVSADEEQLLTRELPAGPAHPSFEDIRAPLPGDIDFGLGESAFAPLPAAGRRSFADAGAMDSETLRSLARERVGELAPEIIREVAWEALPDLLERLIKESAPRSGDEPGDAKS